MNGRFFKWFARPAMILLVFLWFGLAISGLVNMADYSLWRVVFVGLMLWLMGLCVTYAWDLVRKDARRGVWPYGPKHSPAESWRWFKKARRSR